MLCSDENMMDPYNLAICFGPTLVPIPEDRDQVQFQNLVNELIKNFIIFHEDIFPTSVPGSVYEKYLTQEPEDMGDSPEAVDQSHDDEIDSEFTEDDSVFKEDNDKEDDLQDFSLDLFGSKNKFLKFAKIRRFWTTLISRENLQKNIESKKFVNIQECLFICRTRYAGSPSIVWFQCTFYTRSQFPQGRHHCAFQAGLQWLVERLGAWPGRTYPR